MSTAFLIGQTDVSLYWEAFDPTTGLRVLSGIAHDAAGMALGYRREREEPASQALSALGDEDTAHTDGGFHHGADGLVRTDMPDAAFATGVKFVIPTLTSDDYVFKLASVVDLLGGNPRGSTVAATLAADAITAAALAPDAVAEMQSGLATTSALATVAGYIDTEISAIKAKTDLIPAAPAAVSDIPTATANRNAILSWELWTGFSLARLFRVIGIIFRGTKTGSDTAEEVFTAPVGGETVTVNADEDGNRSVMADTASGTP